MQTKWKAALAGLALVALSGTAAARDQVNFTLSIGTPAPVVYSPVYAAPVYYPRPAYVPQRVYYPAVVTTPQVVRYYDRHDYRRDSRHWHHHNGWR